MNLSENFTLKELIVSEIAERHGWDNSPNDFELANLTRLADFLEMVKTALGGKPVMVNSAFRSKAVNDAVGSKDTSQHRLGCAADIRVPGMAPDAVCRALIAAQLPYDQLIREFDAWTHISIPNVESVKPRKQALIIDKATKFARSFI